MTLNGKHAVVTGASRGIGAAVAEALAAQGAKVTLMSRTPPPVPSASGGGAGKGRSQWMALDVTDAGAVAQAFAAARKTFGPVHILINNAGIADSAPYLKVTDEHWRKLFAVNVDGLHYCTRAALPDMVDAGWGRVVNVASVAGLKGFAYAAAYSATKHAVLGLTRTLALEFAKKGITVNAVCPSYVDTDMARNALNTIVTKTKRSEAEALAELTRSIPLGRLIRPEEVAHTVAWLCDPGASAINGQAIAVDGGETM